MNTESDTALLRAIAQDQGWKPKFHGTQLYMWSKDGENTRYAHEMPRWTEDRDAVMELVLKLDDPQFMEFLDWLEEVCHCDGWLIMGVADKRKLITATAMQLATAYARCKNLSLTTETSQP